MVVVKQRKVVEEGSAETLGARLPPTLDYPGTLWSIMCDLVFIVPLQAARRAMAAVVGFSIYHKNPGRLA